MTERLAKAADAVKDDVCGILCPSHWVTAEGRPPHHPKCIELRAALSEAIDEMSYADLPASGGNRGGTMSYDHQPGSPNFDGAAAYEASQFDEWIRALDEDVIQGKFGYEEGEFTVYPELWRPMFKEGLTPDQAWQRALDAFAEGRREDERAKQENWERIQRADASLNIHNRENR